MPALLRVRVLCALLALAVGAALAQRQPVAAKKPAGAFTAFIDVHAHLDGKDPAGSLRAAIAEMQVENAREIFFMPRPYLLNDPLRYDYEAIAAAEKKYPG